MTLKVLYKSVTIVATYSFPFDSNDPILVAESEHLKLLFDDPEIDKALRDEMSAACTQIFDRTANRLRQIYQETKGT